MADKTNFTKEEWTMLLESPMIAGMAVTAADPSGLWGLLKESFAGGTALTKALAGADTNALVKAVVTDFSSSEGRSAARDGLKAKFAASQPSDLKVKAIDALRQVSGLLDAKAPGDAAAFKAWLRQISQTTAEAANEGGGLFGIGGVQVSDAEKATLTEISTALGSEVWLSGRPDTRQTDVTIRNVTMVVLKDVTVPVTRGGPTNAVH